MTPYFGYQRFMPAGRPGFNEGTFRSWFDDWRRRMPGLDESTARDMFSRGDEPEFDDDRQDWQLPASLGSQDRGAVPQTPEPREVPAPGGMLDRFADRMSDMGFGGDAIDKRNALRRALSGAGARLAAGANKEGLAGLGPAIAEAMTGYQGGLAQAREMRMVDEKVAREAEQDRVQSGYMEALTDQMRGKPGAADEERQRMLRERAALVAQRKETLAGLPPEQAKVMAPFVGSEKWDEYLFKVTGEPPKEESGFTLGEGEVRYGPNGEVIARGPAKTYAPGSGGKPWEGVQYLSKGNELVKIDKATGTVTPLYNFSGTGADPIPQRRAIASDIFRNSLEYGGSVKDKDGKINIQATWQAAWEQAGQFVPTGPAAGGAGSPPPGRDPNPGASHILNQVRGALAGGASDEAILQLLKSIPDLRGHSAEDYLARAKALASKRKR